MYKICFEYKWLRHLFGFNKIECKFLFVYYRIVINIWNNIKIKLIFQNLPISAPLIYFKLNGNLYYT